MQGLHVGTDLDHWFGRGRRRRSGGFTLIELILVIAVIAIMAALAMPFIASASRSFRMSRGAREVHAALLQARAAAITSRQNICVQPVTGGYAYRQGTCAGVAWVGPNTDSVGVFRPGNDVTLAGGPVVFTPFGTASPTAVITIGVTGGGSTTVTVQASGRVTIP